MIKAGRTPKIGFLSTLALSLALAGSGCDSSKKDVIVVDAASDRAPTDSQMGTDSSDPVDGGSNSDSVEAGGVETSGEDARLTDEDGSVTKDAPDPSADAAADLNLAVSDTSAD